MYKCVIFDFDGTIGDTEDLALKVAVTLAEKYNFRSITKNEMPLIKGMGAKEAMAYMGISRFRLPFIIKEAHRILKNEVSQAELCKSELVDFFLNLQQSSLIKGIITSNSKENVEAFLELHSIKIFDFLRASSVFGKSRHFKKIIKKYGLSRKDVLYVGDEARDIVAAKKVGIAVAAVSWGFNSKERLLSEMPDYLVEDVSELSKVLQLDG